MELFLSISAIIFLLRLVVDGFNDIMDLVFTILVSVMLGGVISFVFNKKTEERKITTKPIGCANFTVSSQQQFEVWRKEKHGGSYVVLRYNLQENSLYITSIEIKPGDIVPTITDDNILVDVIERYDSNTKVTSYSVDNQSRKCLK